MGCKMKCYTAFVELQHDLLAKTMKEVHSEKKDTKKRNAYDVLIKNLS